MFGKKYRLSKENYVMTLVDGSTRSFKRVIALKNFGFVRKGQVGGWVEDSNILSQFGNCWLSEGCYAFGKSFISDNSIVANGSWVMDGIVSGDAVISNSIINNSEVYEHAEICGSNFYCSKALGTIKVVNSSISESVVSNHAKVVNSEVYNTEISGFADIEDSKIWSSDVSAQSNIQSSQILKTTVYGFAKIIASTLNYNVVSDVVRLEGVKTQPAICFREFYDSRIDKWGITERL